MGFSPAKKGKMTTLRDLIDLNLSGWPLPGFIEFRRTEVVDVQPVFRYLHEAVTLVKAAF